jgi:hypothetical protein
MSSLLILWHPVERFVIVVSICKRSAVYRSDEVVLIVYYIFSNLSCIEHICVEAKRKWFGFMSPPSLVYLNRR